MDAAKLLEYDLKQTLIGLAFKLFGKGKTCFDMEIFSYCKFYLFNNYMVLITVEFWYIIKPVITEILL